jgi:hypothetical protein
VSDGEGAPGVMPAAWSDLVDALLLLSRGRSNDISPFYCEHDQLTVMASPAKFSDEELAQLDEWGFHIGDEDSFYSYRYGSA